MNARYVAHKPKIFSQVVFTNFASMNQLWTTRFPHVSTYLLQLKSPHIAWCFITIWGLAFPETRWTWVRVSSWLGVFRATSILGNLHTPGIMDALSIFWFPSFGCFPSQSRRTYSSIAQWLHWDCSYPIRIIRFDIYFHKHRYPINQNLSYSICGIIGWIPAIIFH